MLDFESAMWRAAASVFPDVRVRGCGFHWNQAVWRKVQGLGLQEAYLQRENTFNLIRRLMALPFLPSEHIAPVFQRLRTKAGTQPLQELVEYIRSTWVESDQWPPAAWTVFRQSIRTNNDVEGWHRRINHRGHEQLPFYTLIRLLHREACIVNIQVRLVSEKKLQRIQTKKYTHLHNMYNTLWVAYTNGDKTAKQLLYACARINGPITE